MIIFNPVIISVIVMIILCVLNLNVILSIMIASLAAGLASGMNPSEVMSTLIGGMGQNAETALSYILLGALAVSINKTGLSRLLAIKIGKAVSGKKKVLAIMLAVISCFSQNLIPVHIAFIPILIPPLLSLMNKLKIDRRAIACALTFGLQAPYIAIPAGFGLIFHQIIKEQMAANAIDIKVDMVYKAMAIPALGMLVGLLIAIFFSYSKDREYEEIEVYKSEKEEDTAFKKEHVFAIIAAVSAFAVQLVTKSLPLGALLGLTIIVATRTIRWGEIEEVVNGGVVMMGFIAFVMLVAAGYSDVLRQTNGIETLVAQTVDLVGGNKVIGALAMLIAGLFVTMGIGTSFGTIPILASIYCPLAMELGFSTMGIIVLIGVAGALGDAGSPASDSTLGPTSGLNIDKQHNHIWDTCIPTFIHYNIPLIIFGVIGAVIL